MRRSQDLGMQVPVIAHGINRFCESLRGYYHVNPDRILDIMNREQTNIRSPKISLNYLPLLAESSTVYD